MAVVAPSAARGAHHAELRMLQFITLALALASALFVVLNLTVLRVAPRPPEWYRAIASTPWLLTFATVLALPFADVRTLRRLHRAVSLCYPVSLVGLIVAGGVGAGPHDYYPWIVSVTGIATSSAVAGWGVRGGRVLLPVMVVLVQLLRLVTHTASPRSLTNDAHNLVTSLVLLIAWAEILLACRTYDRASLRAGAAAGSRAAEAARRAVRVRTQSVVHDEVFTALLLATQGGNLMRRQVATQSQRALELIRQLADTAEATPIDIDVLVERLRRRTWDVDPDATFTSAAGDAAVTGRTTVPPETAAALVDALGQAVTNSVRHAGPGARRTVEVAWTAGSLRATVADDGAGFEPHAVSRDRMGLAVTVLGRVNSQPGAEAHVRTALGTGTQVELTWRPVTEGHGRQNAAWPALAMARLRSRMRPAAVVFGAIQVGLAVLTATRGGEHPYVSFGALAGIAAAMVAVGWPSRAFRVSLPRALLTVAVTAAVAALTLVPEPRGLDYATGWFLTGTAFVLTPLALRDRISFAVAGTAASTAIASVGLVVSQPQTTQVTATLGRPVVVVLFAVAGAVAVRVLQRHTRRLRTVQLAEMRLEAWERARLEEFRHRAGELDALIGELLQELAGDAPLTSHQVRLCTALEGRLRDQYRGGRLSRQPVIDAAMAARIRGVDVVLLDDAPDRGLDETQLEALGHWMSEQLARHPSGRFIGRILPAGRSALASAVGGDVSTLFRG